MKSTTWPYLSSDVKRKPRGFWQDDRTIAVIREYIDNRLTEEEATQKLLVAKGDVIWYANVERKKGAQ